MTTFATIISSPVLVHDGVSYSYDEIICDGEYVFSFVSEPIGGVIYIAIGAKNKFYCLTFNIAKKLLKLSYQLDASRYSYHFNDKNKKKNKIYVIKRLCGVRQISFPRFIIDETINFKLQRHTLDDGFQLPDDKHCILSYIPMITEESLSDLIV